MKHFCIFLTVLCFCCMEAKASVIPSTQKNRVTDGWEFIRLDMANAWEVMRPVRSGQPESVPLWTKVTIPHCYNAEDAVDPDVNYYQGAAWYRIELDLNNPYRNGRTLLEFEGVGQRAEVYVYTQKVGEHLGGYDGWAVDITEAVAAFLSDTERSKRFNGKIPIAVRCDNRRDVEIIPSDMSDFNLYGGIYRYVNLVYTPSISFKQIKITPSVDEQGKKGQLGIQSFFYNPDSLPDEGRLSVQLKDPNGKVFYKKTVLTKFLTDIVLEDIDVSTPLLWDVEDPQLYTCEAALEINGQFIRLQERFGFRHFTFREQGPFMLNGKRLLLKGTHRHEDHAGKGAALTDEQMISEMQMIKEMGVNFIRLGHYQQSDMILRLCDELGILVWEEIPWCRGGLGGTAYREQAKRMLTHMIGQHYNHPSVIIWGLGNENDWPGDFKNFDKDSIRMFMQELHTLSHQTDNTRVTAIRRCEFCKDIVDVYSPTIWAGWYSRSFRDYKEMSEEGARNTKCFFHAEWGGDSHARRHAEGDFAGMSAAATKGDWSESYIVRLFDWHLKEQENMPELTGSAFWTFKDFSTPLRPENPVPYVNQKGVVERDLTPKESYYVFQSYWAKSPMLHIYGHSWPVRWGEDGEKKEVLVYSNCPEVELFLNGVSQGKRKRVSSDFPAAGLRWNVVFAKGENKLRAVYTDGTTRLSDEISQVYQTDKWGEEARIVMSQRALSDSLVYVEALIQDTNGVNCLDSRSYIEFSIAGNGKLIDNQGTSSGSRRVQACNGRAGIKVKKSGICTVYGSFYIQSKLKNSAGIAFD